MTENSILVNCSNLATAGGRAVALNFLHAVPTARDQQIVVLAPAGTGYEVLDQRYRVVYVPDRISGSVLRTARLPRLASRLVADHQIDVVFNVGNIALPLPVPQATVVMFPWLLYTDFPAVWGRISAYDRAKYKLRNRIILRRLRYSNLILPQTETAATRLKQTLRRVGAGDLAGRIRVVPTAATVAGGQQRYQGHEEFQAQAGGRLALLCLSRYYPHKNLEILIDVARLLRQREMPAVLFTTVSEGQHRGAARFLQRIRGESLETVLCNLGEIPQTEVTSLCEQADGLLLPTLLESFSTTYSDFLRLRKPILTSDLDFAREVCGSAALYFDPFDPESVVDRIGKLIDNRSQPDDGSVPLAQSTWDQVARTYLDLLDLCAQPETEIV